MLLLFIYLFIYKKHSKLRNGKICKGIKKIFSSRQKCHSTDSMCTADSLKKNFLYNWHQRFSVLKNFQCWHQQYQEHIFLYCFFFFFHFADKTFSFASERKKMLINILCKKETRAMHKNEVPQLGCTPRRLMSLW